MDVLRSGRLFRSALGLVLLAGIGGCQTSSPISSVMERIANPFSAQKYEAVAQKPPIQNAKNMPLSQGMEISWNLKNVKEQPGVVAAGKSVVGPDGAVELGPYGTCKVAGMNINQAAQAVEKHLSAHMNKPGVRLSTVVSPEDVAWRTAQGPGGVRPIGHQVTEPKDEGPPLQVPTAHWPPNGLPNAAHGGPPIQTSGRRPPPTAHHGGVVPVVPGVPGEMTRELLPPYIIGPPDILIIESLKGLLNQPIRGQHLVRPDGTIGVGAYGSAPVAGMTIDQAREEIAKVIHARLNKDIVKLQDVLDGLSVDVLAYNSKVYYVITDGGGYGEQVVRLPITGNDFVLDAISQINGLPPVASKKHIWVARRNDGNCENETRLPVDWIGITQRGEAATNYQIMPGDRVYVRADRLIATNNFLAKVLAVPERLLGIGLLGSQTVNSIRSGSVSGVSGAAR
ncbi:MAG: polysaccharide biosynthesis/export family protein [Planctomycetes bacterium]|nr:polysaccharide biosynthesis/export family protein [Planctomycetota bacterium]